MPATRQQLSQREIDQVLGHYAIGQVHSIKELAEGSVYSPKVVIDTQRGKLLLKRRARGLDIPAVVAFSHEVVLSCLKLGMCVPPLLATKTGNSLVQFEDHVYELFVFIEGIPFDRSPAMIMSHAQQAGALLGEVHRTLDQVQTRFEASTEPTIIDLTRISILKSSNLSLSQETRDQLVGLMQYGDELAKANAQSTGLVHGDWHPGNMIYRASEIVAVCDFDNTRVGSRTREVAQAMIHFSLKTPTKGQSAQNCDPDPDLGAMRSFWQGYVSAAPQPSTARVCIGLMPAVMIDEALASFPAQAAIGISPQADSMLVAVARKASWFDEHQSELIAMLEAAQ